MGMVEDQIERIKQMAADAGELDHFLEYLQDFKLEEPVEEVPIPVKAVYAKTNTLIKKMPVSSSALKSEELRKVPSGHELKVIAIIKESTGPHFSITLESGNSGWVYGPHWEIDDLLKVQAKSAAHAPVAEAFKTQVDVLELSQPDAVTCQAACVAMATGNKNVHEVRAELLAIGNPGAPSTMGTYMRRLLGKSYIFDDNANLSEMREWLRNGEFLITHGWFTGSGHVVAMDGVSIDENLSYKFDMSDPWSEFDFATWSYNKSSTFYEGFYSALGIYASCVVGQSPSHAHKIYQAGDFDPMRKGAWVHRIRP